MKTIIIIFSLIMTIGLLVMPKEGSVALAESGPVLRISQVTETESRFQDPEGYTFSYVLSPESDNCPLPEGVEGGTWALDLTGNSYSNLYFCTESRQAPQGEDSITFSDPGIYHYTLSQVISREAPNIEYDRNIYDVYVKVANKTGITIEAVWVQRETGEKPDSIQFTNKVKKAKVIGDPPVNVVKRIEGGTPTKKDKFVFVMTPEDENYPLPNGAKGKYETALFGEGEIEIGNIEFSEPGIYEYTVTEKANPLLSYEFDKTVFRVVYEVNMEDDGTMTCNREIIRDDTEEDECEFVNKYKSSPANAKKSDGLKSTSKTGDPADIVIMFAGLIIALLIMLLISRQRRNVYYKNRPK